MHGRSSADDPRLGSDPLTEVLQDLRLTGSFYCRSYLRAPWGLEIPGHGLATFHFVAAGGCFLRGASAEPIRMDAGDLLLLPRGGSHALADPVDSPAPSIEALPHEQIGPNAAILRHGGEGRSTLLICGAVRFEDPAVHPLVELMPDVLHIRGAGAEHERLLRSMLEVLGAEALAPRPGGATVMTRLADVVVIHAVRSWLDSAPEGRSGWLGALRDPQIGRALTLIHRHPGEPWTVGSLAAEVHMSRSVFSERFAALAGVPPMLYLTRWRMHLASGWLREERLGLGEVASRLGYESEPSFSRAFKRHHGFPPGAARRAGKGVAVRSGRWVARGPAVVPKGPAEGVDRP